MVRDYKKVRPWAALLALVLIIGCAVYAAARREPEVLETGSWGLSFREENRPPVADATAEQLASYDARYMGSGEEKVAYLTFDCGYENGHTGQILDTLAKHNAPGAFFVVGNFVRDEPELVRRMAEEGHIVGNHTWSHPDMSAISSKEAFDRELRQVRDAYRTCTGEEMPRYYRPPQGIYSTENLKMAKALGYRTVFWSVAYVDWKQDAQPDEAEALALLEKRIHPGAVVLLHNTSATNAAILDRLLTRWEEMGYRFGTLEELFGEG